ncbi:hypothetical protein BGZ49_004477 [Haplosporangium sp. Z 27]|nr:hypothetical protein BGZ49_004477 [Haplosporangium sp. Z 27]
MDYDAKLAKVYKARKEKPEWEEEMQSAKAKYENARESVLDMMMSIIELQDENVHNLKIYYDALLAYARKSVAILEAIPESVFVTQIHESPTSCHLSPHPSMPPNPPHPSHISTSPHPSHISTSPRPPHISTSPHPSSPHPPPLYTSSHVSSPRPISPHYYTLPHLSTSPHPSSPHAPYSPRVARRSWYDTDDESSAHSDSRSEARVSTPRRRNRASSVSDMHRQSITRPPLGPSRSISHSLPTRRHSTMQSTIAQPPTLSDRPPQYRQVRAIYNFEATAEDELSLHKGDLIRITEEIDHGWWEGESFDSHGVKHEGMFPSNYVEEVPLGTCFEGVCSSSESNRSSIEDEEAYYLRDCNNNMYGEIESGQEPPPEVHAVNIPAARRASSISSQYSNVPVEAGMAYPVGRPTSRSHPLSLSCHKPGVRAPPPPPRRANSDLSRNNNILHQTPDSPRIASPSPMSSNNSGMGYVPRD